MEGAIARIVAAGDGRARWLGLAAAVATLAGLLLGAGVARISLTRVVDARALVPMEGHAFLAAGAGADATPDGPRYDESTLEVFEDGRPLGRPHTYIETIRRLGHGRFFHDPRGVIFSSADGSDPRTNGREYRIRYDWAPGSNLLWAVAAIATLLNARRAARLAARLDAAPPAAIALGLAVLALAFRVQVGLREPELTFGGHLVKGAIFSDAQDWYAAARRFAAADWSPEAWRLTEARRPLHYGLLGCIFALTGPSLAVARALNVLASVAWTVVTFDAVRRVAPRRVALLAGLAQALLLYDARTDRSVMTEPLGDLLAALSLWAFVRGAELASGAAARPRAALIAFVGSGAALGLSNLARPLTLGAAAGMPVALALVAPRIGLPWRRLAAGAAAMAVGVAVTVGPWVVRQHAVHGIWTISENTTEGLYAATSPEHGTWSSAVGDLGGGRSLRERAEFFAEGTRRNLREHTGWYARHVTLQLALAARITQPAAWVIAAACMLHALLALGALEPPRGRRLAAALAALVLARLVLSPAAPLYALTPVAVAVLLARRRPALLLASFVVTTLVSVSVIAMSHERRLTHAVEWGTAALGAWVVFEVLRALEGAEAAEERLGDAGEWGRAGAAVAVGALLAVLVAVAGLGRVLTTTPPAPAPKILPAGPWVARALDGETAAVFSAVRDRLVVRRARVGRGFDMILAADERVDTISPLLDPRPYPRTIFTTESDLPESYVVWPGRLPRELSPFELVLVGVRIVHPGTGPSLELSAIGVGTPGEEPREWLRPAPDLGRRHAEWIAAVSSAR